MCMFVYVYACDYMCVHMCVFICLKVCVSLFMSVPVCLFLTVCDYVRYWCMRCLCVLRKHVFEYVDVTLYVFVCVF